MPVTDLTAPDLSRHAGLPAWRAMLHTLEGLDVPFGRELSFKLSCARLHTDRMLAGVQRAQLPLATVLEIGRAFGMPEAGQALLAGRYAEANAVFFATEESGTQRLWKIYLEFWDAVRARVRAGDTTPQLLHLGVKWSDARPGHHEQASYVCHPLLGLRDVLRRMRAVHADPARACALEPALRIVRQGALRAPQASFLYLEASEAGNPRRSFDVNLYQSGLRVAEVEPLLRAAAQGFGVAGDAWEEQLRVLGPLPLGHVSGGCDRRGEEFLSVYAEIAPLPKPA